MPTFLPCSCPTTRATVSSTSRTSSGSSGKSRRAARRLAARAPRRTRSTPAYDSTPRLCEDSGGAPSPAAVACLLAGPTDRQLLPRCASYTAARTLTEASGVGRRAATGQREGGKIGIERVRGQATLSTKPVRRWTLQRKPRRRAAFRRAGTPSCSPSSDQPPAPSCFADTSLSAPTRAPSPPRAGYSRRSTRRSATARAAAAASAR
eukprot:352555-Chlamydomonas_euryale.AAC.6